MRLSLNKERISENLLYFSIWAAILSVPVLNPLMVSEAVSVNSVLLAWCKTAPYLLIFVVHNFVLSPIFFDDKQYIICSIFDVILALIVFSGVWFIQTNYAYVIDGLESPYDLHRGAASFTDLSVGLNVTFGMLMTAANNGVKLMYKIFKDEQQLERLKRNQLEAEMDYLKYQINPHFFMNTLNNIHALIDIDGGSAQKAIIDLSKMMRHVLYDSRTEVIPLVDDIAFIENYIDLMRIRYSNRVKVTVDYPIDLSETVAIAPLLLIIFVENAFKHGASSVRKEAFIDLNIQIVGSYIKMVLKNSVGRATHSSKGSGIGIANARKRMELLFGKRYTLELSQSNDVYTVELRVPMQNVE